MHHKATKSDIWQKLPQKCSFLCSSRKKACVQPIGICSPKRASQDTDWFVLPIIEPIIVLTYTLTTISTWHCLSPSPIQESSLLGSVLRTSLTQLAGFDCWQFRLISDWLVLQSSPRSCYHSNRSISLKCLREQAHFMPTGLDCIFLSRIATLLEVYPTDPGTVI